MQGWVLGTRRTPLCPRLGGYGWSYLGKPEFTQKPELTLPPWRRLALCDDKTEQSLTWSTDRKQLGVSYVCCVLPLLQLLR